MRLALPFFSGDAWLAEKNLRWMQELDGKLDCHCTLACDNETQVGEMLGLANAIFPKVEIFKYNRHKNSKWPFPQNNAFLHTAWEMRKGREPWLWLETDCTPIKKGWLKTLEDEYRKGGKPFGGHWNAETNVFNGVAIYPPNISAYSRKMMMAPLSSPNQNPWDYAGSKEVKPYLHVMNHVMQHLWSINDICPTFPTAKAVTQLVRPNAVVFHRCKDGTLIDRLREGLPKPVFGQYCLVKDDTVHARNKRFALT